MAKFFTEEQQRLLKIDKESLKNRGNHESEYVVLITFRGNWDGREFICTMPATIEWCKRYCEEPEDMCMTDPILNSRLVGFLK